MFKIDFIFGILISYIIYLIFSYFYRIYSVNNHKGLRQIFSQNNILVLLKLTPEWLTPVNSNFGFVKKWNNLYKKFNDDVITLITPTRTTFYIADPNIAKEVMITEVKKFPKPTFFYKVLSIFGENIVTTEDLMWKRHRKIVSIGFSERNNKLIFSQSIKYVSDLINELKENNTIDVVSYSVKITLYIISSAFFGFTGKWQDNNNENDKTFFNAIETISNNTVAVTTFPKLLLKIFLPEVYNSMNIFRIYMEEKIKKNKEVLEENYKYNDLFLSLINATIIENKEGNYTLSDEELFGNLYALMVAGHETTAHTLSFALGLLALNPEKQDKFYEEIISICGDDKLKYDSLINLKYGMAIMNETLRLYPIVTVIPKWAPNDTVLDNRIFVPAESIINIHVTGLHYNEKYWGKNACDFVPERFLVEYNKDAFVPFSSGIRSCLGKRFAQIEFLTILTSLVQNFKITVANDKDKNDLLDAETFLTLMPNKKVNLKFESRN